MKRSQKQKKRRLIVGVPVNAREREWLDAQARAARTHLAHWVRSQLLPADILETGLPRRAA